MEHVCNWISENHSVGNVVLQGLRQEHHWFKKHFQAGSAVVVEMQNPGRATESNVLRPGQLRWWNNGTGHKQ